MEREGHGEFFARIKQAADCRLIFKRFWPNHFRERGNCFCPFHDDSRSSLQLSRELAFCHAENLKFDAVDLYARATGAASGEAASKLAKELGVRKPEKKAGVRAAKIIAVYDYEDAGGKLLYQSVRFFPKTFRLRRPDPGKKSAWIWNLDGVQRVPYRLPEVLAADTIFVVEGEKDADRLAGDRTCRDHEFRRGGQVASRSRFLFCQKARRDPAR